MRQKQTCSRIAALGVLYHEVARLNEQFPTGKRGDAFRTQTLMRIVEKYEWSRTAEEKVMQVAIKCDELYTHLSASLVIWENEVTRSGGDADTADDRRNSKRARTSFIGFGAQYANPVSRAKSRPLPIFQKTPPRGGQDPASSRSNKRWQTSGSAKTGNGPLRFRTNNEFETRCFKCGRTGHWRAQCTYNDGQSMISAARSRIRDIGGHLTKQLREYCLSSYKKRMI